MDNFLMNINIPVYNITKEEFNDLSLDDVNYSGILFIFTEEYNEIIFDKIDEWQLGKNHRFNNVLDDGMFYVENCDIQTIDSKRQLFSELYCTDTIKKIYVLGDLYTL